MALSYHIPAGETPDKAHEAFYQQQEDGSFILQIDGLPEAQGQTANAGQQPANEEEAPAENSAAKCYGAGAQKAVPNAMQTTHTLISANDAQAIEKSLHALATGAVRLG